MIFRKAKQLGKELGWHKTKDGVFGLYKGYFFNVGDGGILSNPPYKFLIAKTNDLSEPLRNTISEELLSNKKTLRFSNFEVEEDQVYIHFQEGITSTKLKTLYQLLDFLVELFKKHDIPEQHQCHQCGTTETLDYYSTNHRGVLMCQTCYRIFEDSFEAAEKERFAEEKNYMAGFLGSLVFSLPGMVAWVLLAVYLETIASVMAIVIGFLGLKGYQFFKGRMGALTKYLLVLSNIISIIIANIATILTILISIGLTFNQAIEILLQDEAITEVLWENILISFALALFVWLWLLFSLKIPNLTLKRAEKL